jgi:hypothetical protein
MTCQPIDIHEESYDGVASTLEDVGGNRCGCPDPAGRCKALSSGIEPPAPLDPKSE